MSTGITTPELPQGWQAAQLDLHAFRVDGTAAAQDWWKPLIGSDSESSTRKKNERVDSGEYNGHALRVSSDLIRTTWTMAARVTLNAGDGLEGTPPAIGPFDYAEQVFAELTDRWLASEHCPPMIRLAYNARLLWFGNSAEETYQTLGRMLTSVHVEPTSQEFLYRINRPIQSRTIGDIRLNRLGTWSAITLTMQLQVLPQAGLIESPSARTLEHEYHAAMVNLDINTPQDRSEPLPRESLQALWRELIEIGRGVAERGDQP